MILLDYYYKLFERLENQFKNSTLADIFEKFSTFIIELRFYYLVLSKLDHLKLLRLYEWKYFATAEQRGVY